MKQTHKLRVMPPQALCCVLSSENKVNRDQGILNVLGNQVPSLHLANSVNRDGFHEQPAEVEPRQSKYQMTCTN